ncbi:MAG: hypothetical protein KDC02_19515 [Flavobacteriales bacterium]|nr:hypothetical protein [Flavobacteriales bacterium]
MTNDIDLAHFRFFSSDHLRYEQGRHTSGPHGGAPREVRIEPDRVPDSFNVSIHLTEGPPHPIMGMMTMGHKQMRVIERNGELIRLRGWGHDTRTGIPVPFDNYELVIHRKGADVLKVVLFIHDRQIRLEYLP